MSWVAGVASSPSGFRKKDLIIRKTDEQLGLMNTEIIPIEGGINVSSLASGMEEGCWISGSFLGSVNVGGYELISHGNIYNQLLMQMSGDGKITQALNLGEGSGYATCENGLGGVLYGGTFNKMLQVNKNGIAIRCRQHSVFLRT